MEIDILKDKFKGFIVIKKYRLLLTWVIYRPICAETLGEPYLRQVPLPRIPDYRDHHFQVVSKVGYLSGESFR